jgi:hypothetical protein
MSVYATQCPLRKQGNTLVPKFDLSPTSHAGRELRQNYGELIWVLQPNAAPWSPGIFDLMRTGLKGFKGDRDYLLCLGNPVLMSMMSVLAAELSDELRFLQWSNGEYMPLTVQL